MPQAGKLEQNCTEPPEEEFIGTSRRGKVLGLESGSSGRDWARVHKLVAAPLQNLSNQDRRKDPPCLEDFREKGLLNPKNQGNEKQKPKEC